MKTIILLEKRTYLFRLLDMLKANQEISIKDVKKKLPSSTYYQSLLSKLVDINSIFENGEPSYFIKPVFIKQGKGVISGLKRHPNISIELTDSFAILKYEKGGSDEEH